METKLAIKLCYSLAAASDDWFLPRWSYLVHGLAAHCADASVGSSCPPSKI